MRTRTKHGPRGEISLLKTLLHYIDTKTTRMADAPWHNEVTAYTCPERHKREEEILIRKRPLVMGLSCDWPKPGAYRTDDFAGVPILTVRGSDGKLRAFLNVCRHRGAKVAQGCGSAGAFTCPYHGWTYGSDGVLRGLPEEATSFPGVRAERPGLTPLPLAEKYGMVWVLPTPAADRSADLDIDPWLDGMGARPRVVEARHLPFPRSPRALRGDELEAARRHVPRGLSFRLPAQGEPERHPGPQRRRLHPVRAELPPRLRTHQARPAEEHAGERVGPDVEHRPSSTRCSPTRSFPRKATTWRYSACSLSTGAPTAR